MRIKQRDVYTGRYFRHGNSYVVLIPTDLREVLKLVPGDTMLMNVSHGVLWAVKAVPGMIATRERVAKIFDELFKTSEDANASK